MFLLTTEMVLARVLGLLVLRSYHQKVNQRNWCHLSSPSMRISSHLMMFGLLKNWINKFFLILRKLFHHSLKRLAQMDRGSMKVFTYPSLRSSGRAHMKKKGLHCLQYSRLWNKKFIMHGFFSSSINFVISLDLNNCLASTESLISLTSCT